MEWNVLKAQRNKYFLYNNDLIDQMLPEKDVFEIIICSNFNNLQNHRIF